MTATALNIGDTKTMPSAETWVGTVRDRQGIRLASFYATTENLARNNANVWLDSNKIKRETVSVRVRQIFAG